MVLVLDPVVVFAVAVVVVVVFVVGGGSGSGGDVLNSDGWWWNIYQMHTSMCTIEFTGRRVSHIAASRQRMQH